MAQMDILISFGIISGIIIGSIVAGLFVIEIIEIFVNWVEYDPVYDKKYM